MRPALIIIFIMLCPAAYSATISVPADYTTIQEAIDAAVYGDIVLVAPGTYVENIDFLGKAITVKSDLGAESTVIDGQAEFDSVVTFISGEGLDSVLEGFTITNGCGKLMLMYEKWGGGICCHNASPTVINNIVTGNLVNVAHGGYGRGGGIYSDACAVIEGNIIHENSAYYYAYGGGIYCTGSTIVANNIIFDNGSIIGGGIYSLDDCVLIDNYIYENTGDYAGGGISCGDSVVVRKNLVYRNTSQGLVYPGSGISCGGPVKLLNNVIYQNSTYGIVCHGAAVLENNTLYGNISGGIWCNETSTPVICNTILWENGPIEIELQGPEADPVVTYCDVKGGWPGTGNIDSDPLFVDGANDDFHLTYPSPCRDTGDNSAATEVCDFEGDPRIAWSGNVDMGADEFYTHMYITGDQTPGGIIQGRFVGLPGTSPVRLFIGLGGIRPTPLPTAYGDLWLLPPRLSIPLIPIPSSGISTVQTTVPMSPPAPYDVPMQGLIGLNSDSLTNLCVLEVR